MTINLKFDPETAEKDLDRLNAIIEEVPHQIQKFENQCVLLNKATKARMNELTEVFTKIYPNLSEKEEEMKSQYLIGRAIKKGKGNPQIPELEDFLSDTEKVTYHQILQDEERKEETAREPTIDVTTSRLKMIYPEMTKREVQKAAFKDCEFKCIRKG